MINRPLLLILALGIALPFPHAAADLRVVTTLPDLASVARAVGGGHVEVTSLARSTEDPHHVDARPSFIRELNRADALIHGGAELEIGWLPPLVRNARNANILNGRDGNIDASDGLTLLDIPTGPIDRSMGDVHPGGNPHYLLDPLNAKALANALAERFARLDPSNASSYQSNSKKFGDAITARLEEWTRILEPHRDTRVISYHKSHDYFLERFELKSAGTIETKPGIEPSPAHITRLIESLRPAKVRLVLMEPFRSPRTPAYVAEALNASLLALPLFPGSTRPAETYLEWMDHLVTETDRALKAP